MTNYGGMVTASKCPNCGSTPHSWWHTYSGEPICGNCRTRIPRIAAQITAECDTETTTCPRCQGTGRVKCEEPKP